MSHHRLIWNLLAGFVGVALLAATGALFIGPDAEPPTALGWLIVGTLTLTTGTSLALLNPHWFRRHPEDIAGTVLTGVFIRLALAELVYLAAFIAFFLEVADAAALFGGLAVSILLGWLFIAPTRRRLDRLQEQLDRVGGGDVAAALARPQAR